MELCHYHSSATKACVLICGIFFILCHGVTGQNVTCISVESDKTNVFDDYNVTVSGAPGYTLTYEPAEYGPTERFPVGTTEVTVTAMNSTSTVIGTCRFNVTVNLSELPIACPVTNDIEPTDPGESMFRFLVENLQTLSGFTYRPNGPIISVLSTNTTGVVNDRFPVGIHAVSVRYSDDYVAKVCNFTLTVVDIEPPTVNCPDDILGVATNAILYTPKSISDNVPDPALLQDSLTYSPDTLSPGSRFPFGVSTVTISLTDGAGNQANCSFGVNVALQELPIMCPSTMMLTEGTDSGQPFYTYPDPPFNVTYLPESMTYIPYGNITMVRDYGGNNISDPKLAISPMVTSPTPHSIKIEISDGTLEKVCNEATVIVKDREPPTIVCPDDIFQNQTTVDETTFFLTRSVDNSDGILSTAVSPFILTGQDFPVGTTTYTFTALDVAGNNASCSINVTIVLESTNATDSTPESTNATESTPETTNAIQSTAGLGGDPNNLPIIIGCSVAGGVLLLIIIILAICCSSPGRRAMFGIGAKEPGRIVGANRHGVATDPVLLNDRLQRTRSNIYADTIIDDPEMAEAPDMTDTNGATGGLQDTNGMHINDAYGAYDDDITLAKSAL